MTGDRVWRMPLYSQYSKQIEGQVADINNIGTRGRLAGSCTAAAFLKVRYCCYEEIRHAHIDLNI